MIVPARLPLTRYQGLLWSVELTIGGEPRTLLVDLGAGVTCLSPEIVRALEVPLSRRVSGRRMTNEVIDLDLHCAVSLGFGEVVIEAERIGALDLSVMLPEGWPAVDGVLALDVLAGTPCTFDFVDDVLVLETPTSLALRIDRGRPLLVRGHQQIEGTSLVVLAGIESPAGTLWFELDNSNTGPVIVTPATAVTLGVEDGANAALEIPGLGAVTSPVVVRDILYDGNLGRRVLDGRRLTFDLAHGAVYAAPKRAGSSSQNQL